MLYGDPGSPPDAFLRRLRLPPLFHCRAGYWCYGPIFNSIQLPVPDTRTDLGLSKAWTDLDMLGGTCTIKFVFRDPPRTRGKIRYHHIDDQGNLSWIYHLLRVSRTDKQDSRQGTLYRRLENIHMPLVHGATFEDGASSAAII